MILPIVAYGDPVLKKECEEIDENYEGLKELIDNMWDTMYNANGVGLAAPQVGASIRLFVVDASPFSEDIDPDNPDPKAEGTEGFKKVFINPIIEEEDGEDWGYEEGCLSIPGIREDVYRKEEIVVTYFDENFEFHEETYDGYRARIIQHEYDHLEGVLFTDHLSALKRKLLSKRLVNIAKGEVDVAYKMAFPTKKRRR